MALPLRLYGCIVATILWPSLASAAAPPDLKGAEAILKQVNEMLTASLPSKAEHHPPTAKPTFGATPPLPTAPAKTAAEWLVLVDPPEHTFRIPLQMHSSFTERPNPLALLPPPEEWEPLRQLVLSRKAQTGDALRREIGLRLLSALLIGDEKALEKDLEMAKAAAADPSLSDALSYAIPTFSRAWTEQKLSRADDPATLIALLEADLTELSRNPNYHSSFKIPDIVALVGKEQASSLIRRALLLPDLTLELPATSQTTTLARNIAMELLPSLKTPPWYLVNSIETTELYEKLRERFLKQNTSAPELLSPLPSSNDKGDFNERRAHVYYAMGLIAQGRVDDAVKAVVNEAGDASSLFIQRSTISDLKAGGFEESTLEFLRKALSANSSLPYWPTYIAMATEAGKAEEMLKLLRLQIKAATPDHRWTLLEHLVEGLLAADHIDEALPEMQRLLAVELPGGHPQMASKLKERGTMALRLARLGLILDRPPLIDEGLRIARESLDKIGTETPATGSPSSEEEAIVLPLAELLVELKRPLEAEVVLEAHMVRVAARSLQIEFSKYVNIESNGAVLLNMMAFYHYAGRPQDVLDLLDKAPLWNSRDLASFVDKEVYPFSPANCSPPAGYFVASALADVGRKEEARVVLQAVLRKARGFDPAYALLIKLDGQKALAELDARFAEDRFQERPLIWKAHLLLKAGEPAAAETVIRQAIAIDPSDGEQGAGDRMRAYAVLAEIREALGDKKEAAFYREVVAAIRLSEEADRLHDAGLLSRAITLYQEALSHFADAYCIQSRLARELWKAGRTEEAGKHYQRAFELMPDSFGRIESHCFGCEEAFGDQQQQTIAESVFEAAIAATPDKPQLHYLLGYLRKEQERPAEALASFRTATRLDPDYLNAWKYLVDVSDETPMPSAERDAAILALMRLDPFHQHIGKHKPLEIRNFRTLWSAVEEYAQKQPAPPATLYPLAASTIYLQVREEATPHRSDAPSFSPWDAPLTPAGAIGMHPLVLPLLGLLR